MSGGGLAVRELSEERYSDWNGLVAASPSGSGYATPEYLEALCRATGGSFRIIAAFKGEEIVGGLPLYVERQREGLVVSPRLLLYYNGPVLREYEASRPWDRTRRHLRTLRALEAFLRRGEFARVTLKPRSPIGDVRVFVAEGWQVRPVHTYVVPIADMEALRHRLDRNARRLIDRATRQGLELTRDEDFDSFYRFHREIHERKGAPLYLPEARFRRFFEALHAKDLLRLYHARLPDGRSAAAQIVLLGPHPVTHTICAGGDDEHLDTGANPFLRWKVFEDLSDAGYEGNDLTDASLNPVTDFKAQLGGDLETCLQVSRWGLRAQVNRFVQGSAKEARRRVRLGLRQVGLNL